MCLSKLPSCWRYWSFNKSQLVIVLAVWDTADLIPAAPGEGRVLAGFAEILFTLITWIRVLVYAAGRGRTFLCSGGHAGSAVSQGSVGMGVRTPGCNSRWPPACHHVLLCELRFAAYSSAPPPLKQEGLCDDLYDDCGVGCSESGCVGSSEFPNNWILAVVGGLASSSLCILLWAELSHFGSGTNLGRGRLTSSRRDGAVRFGLLPCVSFVTLGSVLFCKCFT